MSAAPPGHAPFDVGAARGFAKPELTDGVGTVIEEHGSLFAFAERHPDRRTLQGRGAVHVVEHPHLGSGARVIRRYLRGGAVAGPLLKDRHLRAGPTRPEVEARASSVARERGVPTPEVLAGAWYPGVLFYRAEVMLAYIPGTSDLASALFGTDALAGTRRRRALEAAGELVARVAAAGIRHPDLNAGNILLSGQGEGPRAFLLDLDRCRTEEAHVHIAPAPMLRRLERSLRKLGKRLGPPLSADDWHALRAAAG